MEQLLAANPGPCHHRRTTARGQARTADSGTRTTATARGPRRLAAPGSSVIAATTWPVVAVPPMRGVSNPKTDSCTPLTVRRFCRVAGWCQAWLDVPSDQVVRGPVWLGGCGRWLPVGLPHADDGLAAAVVIERRTRPRCGGGVLTSAGILIAARQLAGARSRLAAVAGSTSAASRCLDAAGPGSADGTPLQIWGCTGGANQQRDVPG